jgi:hypothetical protein
MSSEARLGNQFPADDTTGADQPGLQHSAEQPVAADERSFCPRVCGSASAWRDGALPLLQQGDHQRSPRSPSDQLDESV